MAKQIHEVKYPAAAAGPASGSEEPLARREGLPPGHEPFRGGAWPGGSCGASNSLKNFLPPCWGRIKVASGSESLWLGGRASWPGGRITSSVE